MKATLKLLSICKCGFTVLDENITLGTEYEIDPSRKDSFTFICGGCRKKIQITGVWVEARNGGHAGYLPELIFQDP